LLGKIAIIYNSSQFAGKKADFATAAYTAGNKRMII